MKIFSQNKILKKILIIFIVIIMTSSFVMPHYVQAASPGEKLVSGLFYLIAKLGDVGISFMQKFMIGDETIVNEDNFEIQYSPEMIFSNKVVSLDVNFIQPKQAQMVQNAEVQSEKEITELNASDYSGTWTQENVANYLQRKGYLDRYNAGKNQSVNHIPSSSIGATGDTYMFNWQEKHYGINVDYSISFVQTGGDFGNEITPVTYTLRLLEPKLTITTKPVNSPANELHNNIATWYKALRTIALVGLLSVLVYIGIRIILSSSSAQDKAKYKNMLKDWVVAICILFLLHYVMAFMLQITQTANDIILLRDANGNTLMSAIREKVGDNYNDANVGLTAGYTVMYLALVILTGVFTVQYLKRVIYMAFLTMIAPMIALTYPLDKIKDGKAQAFSFWLREYIFNCLIQPVHLILYTILISSARDLAVNNMLYAIVALGFLVPAEKFIKKMFGLDSQSPVGTLGAAAGGAMVMSMLNKIKGKPPKSKGEEGKGGSNSPSGVRTANNNKAGTPAQGNNTESSTSTNGNTETLAGPAAAAGAGTTSSGTNSSSTASSNIPSPSTASAGTKKPGIKQGLKNAGKNLRIKGVDSIKSAGIGILKSAPGAVLGGTLGLAATVASGGENATTFIGGGVAAGSALSSNLMGGAASLGKGIYEDYQKGKYGTEAYNNKKFDDKFFKSEDYKVIAEDSGLLETYGGASGIKTATQGFLNNGITDAAEIRGALQVGITGDEYKSFSSIGIKKSKEMASAKAKWGTASAYNIAKKVAPLAKNKTKTEFVKMAENMNISKYEAEKIYTNMLDLL